MAIQLFLGEPISVGQSSRCAPNPEMYGLRVVFRYTITNAGSGTFQVRGDLRSADGRVLVSEIGAVGPGESGSGETTYDTVPPGAHVELVCLMGEGRVTVDTVDLDPPTAALAGTGWADYEHSGSVQAILKNTWTTLVNDGEGAVLSTDKSFLPIGVPDIFDVSGNKLDLDKLTYGSQVNFRFDITVNPAQNNRDVRVRLLFNDTTIPATWSFEGKRLLMRSGAGVDYSLIELFTFFVADFWSNNLVVTPQVYCTSDANITVNGWYIRMH